MSITTDFVLYSDGGGERTSTGAGACIVEDTRTKNRVYLAVFLGGATNNESEICAALLGFSFLCAIGTGGGGGGAGKQIRSIRWVCDSEYVLKSATQYIYTWQTNGWRTAQKKPVKNQGLWQTFLNLSKETRITAEHVAGHKGHPENEECDLAACWLQTNGADALFRDGDGALIDVGRAEWVLIDGQKFLANLRKDSPSEDEMTLLVDRLAMLGVNSFSGKRSGSGMSVVVKKIEAAKALAQALSVENEQAATVVAALEQLLARIAAKQGGRGKPN